MLNLFTAAPKALVPKGDALIPRTPSDEATLAEEEGSWGRRKAVVVVAHREAKTSPRGRMATR